MLPPNRKIVALADQWNEAKAEHARSGSGGDATIGFTGLYLPGGLQVPWGDAVVPSNILESSRRRLSAESSKARLPAPFSRLTMATSRLARSSILLTFLGLPGAVTIPSSQTAKVITATAFLGNMRPISGRLDSPLDSSRRCVPAICTQPSLSSLSDCELLRCASTNSTPLDCKW